MTTNRTVWTKLREGLLTDVMFVGSLIALVGLIAGSPTLPTVGAVIAGVALLLNVPVLVLEYRADQRDHLGEVDE